MAAVTLFAGEKLTAALLLSLLPVGIVKPSDQSLTSNTTLQNDNDLVVSLQANTSYHFECFLDYEGGTAGAADIKWGWTLPAGITLRYIALYENLTPTLAGAVTWGSADVVQAQSNGAGNRRGIFMNGACTTVSAGNMQLQWAQNTSSATATIVHANSKLVVVPLPT